MKTWKLFIKEKGKRIKRNEIITNAGNGQVYDFLKKHVSHTFALNIVAALSYLEMTSHAITKTKTVRVIPMPKFRTKLGKNVYGEYYIEPKN